MTIDRILDKYLFEEHNKSAEELEKIIEKEIGFENLPKGWTRKSLTKFARSLTGKTKADPKGFWTECFNRIKDEEGFTEERAKRFCAALKDEYLGTTKWRGKDKD